MEILEAIQYLNAERGDKFLGEGAEGLEGRHERAIFSIFEYNIDMVLAADKSKVLNDVGVG